MSLLTPEAKDIARYVTSFLKDGLGSPSSEVSTVNTATGTPVDWHTNFREIVAPTIQRGSQLLRQKYGLELLGYAKILVDQFSEDTFLYLATSITTDDLEGLSWGRIVALFTVLCLVSTDLTEKRRCDTVELLQEWLAVFLSREDVLEWVAKQGGWIGIRGSFQLSPGQGQGGSGPSWWQSVLKGFVNKVFGPSKQEQVLQKMEKELASLREQTQRNTQQLSTVNSKLGEIQDEQLRQHRADLDRDKQLDRIEEGVDECNDRQVTKWRAEQDRDDARKDQIDGGISQVNETVQSTLHHESRKTRKAIKKLENVLRDKPHPPPPPPPDNSSDSSPDSLPPDVANMFT